MIISRNGEQMDIDWKDPWRPVESQEQTILRDEIMREIGPGHSLHGFQFHVLGRRVDSDDVLLAVNESHKPLAIVHLTWSGKVESDAEYPHVEYFNSAYEALEWL
jgi:hypothetical protein